MAVLVLNGGSSSWKSALFEGVPPGAIPSAAAALEPVASAALAWREAGRPARLEASAAGGASITRDVTLARGGAAVPVLLDAYRELGCEPGSVRMAGHRIVHGGPRFRESVRLDDAAVRALRELEPFAPRHNPIEIEGILALSQALPGVPQYGAFDTAFHRTLPARAYVYGGPYEWLERDVRRYGFHGINVAYCLERSAQLLGREAASLRLLVAHLGGGCSVTAIEAGESVDTSMGFTPLDGLVMGTRSGAVDPGILVYLMRETPAAPAGETAARLDDLLNAQSGLLGLSGVSADLRDVEAAGAGGDARAELALEVFTYRLATCIGALLPALQRPDALIFTGGIGERAAQVRARVCARLAYAGIELDAKLNAAPAGDGDVATAASRVRVLIVQAREEWYVARECARVAAAGARGERS